MPLILHLSDLHLGARDPAFDDAKTELISKSERDTRQKTIRRTLKRLGRHLKESGEHLDTILVTGDITYGGDEKGFEDFRSVLQELGEIPPTTRIAVVPGNHDVARGTLPSCSSRYNLFRKHIRANRFITPLLDGIDISSTGGLPSQIRRHFIVDRKNKWIVMPVNSSNYCQMIEPIAPDLEPEWASFEKGLLKKPGQKAVQKALENLRLNDVARVSIDQFDALEELLNKINEIVSDTGDDPDLYLRIAILHHHLLPVSTVEEIKKFESITNLGLLRHFLAKHKFDLVLHGHKHIAKWYWDHIPFAPSLLAYQLLVISGGTLGETYHAEDDVCRLIRLCGPENARTLSIARIRGLVPGDNIDNLQFEPVSLWEGGRRELSQCVPLRRIVGKDADEVYNRVLADFVSSITEKHRYNLVCQIADGRTADRMPRGYPDIDAVPHEQKQQWFDKLVDWWQLRQPTLSKTLHFTHGDRIYRGVDQIENVITLLTNRPRSSRAVVTLCRPQTDSIHEHKIKFPSFCLVQFLVRETTRQNPMLDCVGYFRKQEMKYWWPVNVAELARLQKKVFDDIPKTGDFEHLQLGSITTFASIARIGKRPPQVAVPIVDRNFDQNRELLWTMSYALFWPDKIERRKFEGEWEKVLRELVPEGGFDPDGVPVPLEGLKFLLTTIDLFASHHSNAHARKLVKAMRDLQERNEAFVDTLYQNEEEARQKYRQWEQRATRLVQEMRTSIRNLVVG